MPEEMVRKGQLLDHRSKWRLGNKEDGVLVGLDNLIQIWKHLDHSEQPSLFLHSNHKVYVNDTGEVSNCKKGPFFKVKAATTLPMGEYKIKNKVFGKPGEQIRIQVGSQTMDVSYTYMLYTDTLYTDM